MNVPEMTTYCRAVLATFTGDLAPDHVEEYGEFSHRPEGEPRRMVRGFRYQWNAPDAWPYGVRVRWDEANGWIFHEAGLMSWTPRKLVDELVPYPELVAAALIQLLDIGPDPLPLTGATRWHDGDALLASLAAAPG